MAKKTLVPLVVTTEHKGVFFGYGEVTAEKTVRLEKVRMCVYWPSAVRGVVGLSVTGPLSGSKITPAAPAVTLQGVTSIMEVTPEAEAQWNKAIWH